MHPNNIRSLLFSFLCALVLLGWNQPGSAGVVIITGDDADEDGHCYRDVAGLPDDGTLCGSLYPNALNLAISSSTSPGSGIVAIGGANCGTAGKALQAWNDVANGGPGVSITVLTSTTAITSVNLSDFKMLYIPSIAIQLGGFCGVEVSQLAALNTLGPQIQTFVNVTGGSVIALTEADAPNKPAVIDPYGWLPFPFVVLNGDFRDVTTTVNMALVSPTTTSSNLSQGGVFHNVFETPLPSGFLSLANSAMGSSINPHDHLLGKPAYVISTIISPENCIDGIDNDGDGLIDKNDPDCFICGDEIVDPIEQCDDGNLVPGDGCDTFCRLEGPIDTDSDGVPDALDFCSSTVLSESLPTELLGVNRFALVDGDDVFDTTSPKGQGPRRSYTTTDTAGCSCTQIIDGLSLGDGHTKFGCSISAMDDWLDLVN